MPKIETILQKEKFRKSNYRPWNFMEELQSEELTITQKVGTNWEQTGNKVVTEPATNREQTDDKLVTTKSKNSETGNKVVS